MNCKYAIDLNAYKQMKIVKGDRSIKIERGCTCTHTHTHTHIFPFSRFECHFENPTFRGTVPVPGSSAFQTGERIPVKSP